MRKVIGIFVMTLLIGTALSTITIVGRTSDDKICQQVIFCDKEQSISSLPSEWDWRVVDGIDWTSSIKDLLGNPFCMAFSFCSVFEACVHINDGDSWGCDLSEAHLICHCGGPESFIWPDIFIYDVMTKGIVDEACFPFSSNIDCDDICDDWEEHATKILGTKKIYGTPTDETRDTIKKFLIKYGPVQSIMDQYEDFQTYSGGIYEHQSGDLIGPHGVAIIGYNDDPGYWIGKDQKGTNWGEDGWFRIKYGDCKIESQIIHIQLRENPPPTKPNTPSGPSSGTVGEDYSYLTSSSDIEGDGLYYKWDWGDGNVSDWLGPYDSGISVEASYNWGNVGEYNIKVKAKDDFFDESEWSDPISVTIPKNKDMFNPWFEQLLERFPILSYLIDYEGFID